MLGTASLRSQQPSKSSLKTYGGRRRRQLNSGTSSSNGGDGGVSGETCGKREGDSPPPTRQFDWDRLEKERKERLERQAREQERLARSEDETAFLRQDVDLEALLYSDQEDQEEDVQEMREESSCQDLRSGSGTASAGDYVRSTQGSDDDDVLVHQSQTRPLARAKTTSAEQQQQQQQQHLPIRTRGHRPVAITFSQVNDSDPEFELPRRAAVTTTKTFTSPILSGRKSIGKNTPGRVSFSFSSTDSTTPDSLSISQQRKVVFQEKSFFEHDFKEDDEEEEEEGEDEVLFRTPSFDILKRLRELPTPKIPEPRANPFGFRPLSSTSGSTPSPPSSSSSGGRDRGQLGEFETTTPSPIPPPNIDLFDNPFLSPESPTAKRTMEILRRREQQLKEIQSSNQTMATKNGEEAGRGKGMAIDKANQIIPSRFGQDSGRQDRKRPSVSCETTPERKPTTAASRSCADGSLGGQDDCVDMALGKRMSSIEITPRRLLAKQRKTAPYDSDSPTRSMGTNIHFSPRTTFEPPVRPLKLFLDRDIPKDEEPEEHGLLFTRPRSNKTSSPFTSTTSSLPNKRSTGSDPNRLLWPPTNGDRENNLPRGGQEGGMSALRTNTAAHEQSTPGKATASRSHWLDSSNLQRAPLSSVGSNQAPASAPLAQKRPSAHQPQQPQQETQQQQQQKRPIRSLRRPPAALVNHSKKAVFKPTVMDLLSICDQQFFQQFHGLDSVTPFEDTGGCSSPKDILDFDMVLPKCMVSTLTKIGEASYSEVYTVELPIQQQEQKVRNSAQQSPALFQSPRLNTYVKESADDDLNQRDSRTSHGGQSTKLVMKVLPFYDEQYSAPPSGLSSPTKGSRRNKNKSAAAAAAATTELLALEDIYREAMVSTQIMHGWKGFIGSFGALVVKGKYPKAFLSAWDRFRRENGTESYRPDHYTSSQLYCIILLPYGGIDLEHCSLTNWRQAWTVLTQVAASLESKEQAPFWFEHRDLHWGNILVKGTRQEQIAFPRRHLQHHPPPPLSSSVSLSNHHGENHQLFRNVPTFGIAVQMIDFTLARVQGDKGNLIYMDLEKDEDLFKGQGDYQFEIYRKMRRQIGKDWTASCPRTNLFWLHYIADKLLNEKDLEEPKLGPRPPETPSLYTTKRIPTTTVASIHDPRTDEEKLEGWCYERVLAISEMNLDRLDPSGQTPSAMVLDQLLFERPALLT
ncbi:hypothetical protein BGX23_007338 [Mortierella sp. AD031]|nr:hypothetical protein BGX23_007338 [Mortierella sp. AD031]